MRHFCYFNLHKFVFSVRNQKTRLVEHHSNTVVLNNCKLKVSQRGRERVLREKVKNVHAGVEGVLCGFQTPHDLSDFVELTYNPYKYNSFVIKATGEAVSGASVIVLKDKKIFAKEILK
jgi:hypothetical protein